VVAALRAEQNVIRLLNDLGTYGRDVAWGDLNALLLHADPGGAEIRREVTARLDALMAAATTAITPLARSVPGLAEFLLRQIGFCAGFYGITDFWGQSSSDGLTST
jgi:hypothetical protein